MMKKSGVRLGSSLGSLALAAVGLAACAAWAAPEGAAPASHPVLLRAAHLFDSVSGTLTEPGAVLVQDGKILKVGRTIDAPAGAEVIDLGNATLTPGFIDAHVHLSGGMSENWYRDFFETSTRFAAERALYGAANARITLEAGITTVRDVGSQEYIALGLRNAINAGKIPGPRMLVSNYNVGATGGHADDNPFPPGMVAPYGPIQGVCNGVDECRAAVRYQIKYGADLIKFMPSGGVLSLTDPIDNPQLTQEEMNAIVSEAHAWGRKVAAHCHGDRAAKMAIAAGTDSIEHGTFLQEDTLLEMKRKHVYLVPTAITSKWVGEKADTFPPVLAAKSRAAAAGHAKMLATAVRVGTPIAMGTDAAVAPHGTNAQEFALLVGAGMTPAQALLAGTAAGADLLGVKDVTGTLEAGKSADVLALPGNVLQDIHATEHPLLVMKEGVVYVRPH